MKSQIELAKEKGIEVGDRVKVVAIHMHEWMEHMTGLSFIVEKIGDKGATNDEIDYWFPVQSLEKVVEVKLPAVPSWDANRVHISVHMTKREYFAAILYRGDVAQAVKDADALIAELNKWEGV